MNSNYFFLTVLGFAGGIFLASFWSPSLALMLCIILVSASIFSYAWYLRKQGDSSSSLFAISLFCFLFSLGLFRYSLSLEKNPLPENLIGKQVIAEGVISDEPDERDTNTKLTISLDQVSNKDFQTKILATVSRYSDFHYGDRIKLTGILARPENFSEDNGKEFDYVSYLAKDGIYYMSKNPKVEVVSSGGGNFIKRNLFALKNAFIEKINNAIPSPQSSLLGGLLLGAKRSLGTELSDEFRRAGVIHVVGLSGYDVTIVASAIMKFFSFLPQVYGISFGAGSIFLFAIMTGASATTVRASIMALLALLAKWIGRRYDVVRALLIAGVIMILFNPKILVFDVSFQLSFLSTLALIYVSPLVHTKFHFLPEKFQIKNIVVSTVATQIFVLPFLLYQMGDVSLVGLPVNILILGFIPLTMFLGFLTGLLSFFGFVVAFPFALLTNFLLLYELKVVHLFSSLPFAMVSISYFPALLMISFYIFYGIILFRFHKRVPSIGNSLVSSSE
ncbi:MAG: ComEC/Rec2 family competence protein [Candidatus Pacebacteria bacterium]|nr:ComEC/Rec2 family competence protein [Candidatus Paceibacterota bacterium]